MSYLEELKCVDCDIGEFTLSGLEDYAKVVHVYDGDTCHVVIKYNNRFTKFTCRLLGLDTAEMTSKDETKKQRAIQARNFLINKVTGQTVKHDITKKEIKELLSKSNKLCYINFYEQDKYGRWLVDLYENKDDKKTINQQLIDTGLACPYDGGHKNS